MRSLQPSGTSPVLVHCIILDIFAFLVSFQKVVRTIQEMVQRFWIGGYFAEIHNL